MDTISFEAHPITRLNVKTRKLKKKPLTQTEKFKQVIKEGMAIDKLPQTGLVVGLMVPLPLTSVILSILGAIVKYSYKGYKGLQKKSLDIIV